jgi:actin-binding LIM protein
MMRSDVSECAGCGKELSEGQALVALDQQWHIWCFQCGTCGIVLHGEYMGRNGKPYCERDYQKQFGIKCAYCNRYISGKVLQVRYHNDAAKKNTFFFPKPKSVCVKCVYK